METTYEVLSQQYTGDNLCQEAGTGRAVENRIHNASSVPTTEVGACIFTKINAHKSCNY